MVQRRMSTLFTESQQTNENILAIINETFQEMAKMRESFESQCAYRMNLARNIITDKTDLCNELSKIKKEILQYEKNIEELEEKKSTSDISYKKLQCQLDDELASKITEQNNEVKLLEKL